MKVKDFIELLKNKNQDKDVTFSTDLYGSGKELYFSSFYETNPSVSTTFGQLIVVLEPERVSKVETHLEEGFKRYGTKKKRSR